jgi:hemolysin III
MTVSALPHAARPRKIHVAYRSAFEERFNAASHGVGLLGLACCIPFLIHASAGAANARHMLGVSIYACSLLLAYLASALYHGLPHGRAKAFWFRVDRMSIYLFIAGTYTAAVPCWPRSGCPPWRVSCSRDAWACASGMSRWRCTCWCRRPVSCSFRTV